MEPIAHEMDEAGFWSLEVWGGATFDVATRFLVEDPWERVKTLKAIIKKTPLQMLLRGQNLVGYRNYPDDVVKAFVHHAADVGIDVFRVFDALNDERNFEAAARAIKDAGKHFQACICYSVTEPRMGGPVYNIEYFLSKADLLQEMGADTLCIKDMAGLLAPYDAYELVSALKQRLSIPVQLHTHYTSGMASMTIIKAIEAGLDIVDTCLSPYAMRTSQAAIEPLVVTLNGTERDPGLDLGHLLGLAAYFESIAPKYSQYFDTSKTSVVDTAVLSHQIPGGMASNLASQLKEADALDRLGEVYEELPRVRQELGYPPLVTPTSQIVGVQAVQNVLFGRYNMVSGQVKDYVYGLYGRTPTPIDPEVTLKVLKGYEKGEAPISGRAGDFLEPEMDQAAAAILDISQEKGDVLTYALYPVTGLRYLRWKYGLDPIPDELKPDAQKPIEQELPVTKPTTTDGTNLPLETLGPVRIFNVRVDNQIYQVEVEPSLSSPISGVTFGATNDIAQPQEVARSQIDAPLSKEPTRQKGPEKPDKIEDVQPATKPATPVEGISVIAPMPGILLRYAVEIGQQVKKGDPILYLEAMKMENALTSPENGTVTELKVQPGVWVAKNELLAVIK
jgi:pyruvate carboxylase subunit B